MDIDPTIGNRQSKISEAYCTIIDNNLKLEDALRRTDLKISMYARLCKELEASIRYLFVNVKDSESIGARKDKEFKSLSEEIKGKNGFIRSRLEGTIGDFSGRTVISQDPLMPIDCIGVPIDILKKVAEPILIRAFKEECKDESKGYIYHKDMTSFYEALTDAEYGISYRDFLIKYFNEHDVYGIIGRQPTLFYLGMQGFKIKPVENNAIVLSPLVVMPFNADFDGDQMHFSMPITRAGAQDVKNKMLFKNNIFYPKNGEVTVVIRHEILFGIWTIFMAEPEGTCPAKSNKEIYDGILNGTIPIEAGINGTTAGMIALGYCVYGEQSIDESKINTLRSALSKSDASKDSYELKAKKFSNIIMKIAGHPNQFLISINKIVRLGFHVASMYAPGISSVMPEETKRHVKQVVDDFNNKMLSYKRYVDLGLELASNYSLKFGEEYDKLDKELKTYLMNSLDKSNGYWRMVVSGAKGDSGNIMQIFGIKGRIQKSELESFDTLIEGSYATDMSGLEHFITAYGSRKGLSDKTLSTAMPGYMSRKLEHAGAPLNITTKDCATGMNAYEVPTLEFYPETIIPFIDSEYLSIKGIIPENEESEDSFRTDTSVQIQVQKAIELLSEMLVNRNVVYGMSTAHRIESKNDAIEIIRNSWLDESFGSTSFVLKRSSDIIPVRMRSPMTCLDPCCQVCYGRDLSKQREVPEIGRRVGFIAAQSIGEPGTQLVMKNFQKGGVVGESNITSSFQMIEELFDLTDYTKRVTDRKMIMYDPVSPVTGYVKKINIGNDLSRIIITKTDHISDNKNLLKKKLIVNNKVRLKRFVRRGDSMFFQRGNVPIRDIIRYRSYIAGCVELMLSLYMLHKSTDVNLVHFECILRNMMCYRLMGNYDIYLAGSIVTFDILRKISEEAEDEQVLASNILIGVGALPKYKQDFMQSLAMERQTEYVPRAIISSRHDTLNDPIVRTALGLYL